LFSCFMPSMRWLKPGMCESVVCDEQQGWQTHCPHTF
jgi:hypothetical protein